MILVLDLIIRSSAYGGDLDVGAEHFIGLLLGFCVKLGILVF